MSIILQSLSNNIGLITLIVGFLAIYLYLKQKADAKRDITKLILQEIRYAEQQIRNSMLGSGLVFALDVGRLPRRCAPRMTNGRREGTVPKSNYLVTTWFNYGTVPGMANVE